MRDCCDELSWLRPAAQGRGPGRGGTARDRARCRAQPEPASTVGARPLGRARARGLRSERAHAADVRRRHRPGARRGPPDTAPCWIFIDRRRRFALASLSSRREYRRLRPKLALPDSGLVFPEDTRLRWHPSAASFHTLHAEGKLSVLPAVGYTDADQSHFTSRHYWEVGDTNPGLQTGWLGRYLDRVGTPRQPAPGSEPRR